MTEGKANRRKYATMNNPPVITKTVITILFNCQRYIMPPAKKILIELRRSVGRKATRAGMFNLSNAVNHVCR